MRVVPPRASHVVTVAVAVTYDCELATHLGSFVTLRCCHLSCGSRTSSQVLCLVGLSSCTLTNYKMSIHLPRDVARSFTSSWHIQIHLLFSLTTNGAHQGNSFLIARHVVINYISVVSIVISSYMWCSINMFWGHSSSIRRPRSRPHNRLPPCLALRRVGWNSVMWPATRSSRRSASGAFVPLSSFKNNHDLQ